MLYEEDVLYDQALEADVMEDADPTAASLPEKRERKKASKVSVRAQAVYFDRWIDLSFLIRPGRMLFGKNSIAKSSSTRSFVGRVGETS